MSYAETIFEAKVRRVWHPDHLQVMSLLLNHPGYEPAMTPRRVLSVGCGTGVHLVPLACQYPTTQFIGCDPEEQPLARGRSFRDFCRLSNLDFVIGTVSEVAEELFDIVLVQGVYSWVSEEARDALLVACAKRLSPRGVLLLTHNVAPGWTIRTVIQEYLLSRGIVPSLSVSSETLSRARSALEQLRGGISHDSPYGSLLSGEVNRILGESTSYLRHEFLNPHTTGAPLSSVVAHARQAGLQYLGDARISRNPFGEVGRNRGETATHWDFSRGVAYRESLFTTMPVAGGFQQPASERFEPLSFGTSLREDEEQVGEFRDPAGREFSFTPSQPEYRVLQVLAARWPQFASWEELRGSFGGDYDSLISCVGGLLTNEMVIPAIAPPRYTPTTDQVSAPRWLGWELNAAKTFTNRLYEPVELGGFESMLLSSITGGIATVAGLVQITTMQVAHSPEHRSLPHGVIHDTVLDGLVTLARAGLIHEVVSP